MHYLSAENLTKAYGITPLFENISFHISEGDKVALVARNGVGKSTLLRIIAGRETADSGKLWINKDVKVVLFEQEPIFTEGLSIAENIFQHDHPILNAIRRYEQLAETAQEAQLMQAIQQMDDLGAWVFDAKVKQILGRLNIHQLDRTVGSLSGGQRKRVALARTLIDAGFEPAHTLLLMDEPTNHLDVEMVEWLENYLDQEKITLLMVTHDRYFLDAVCDEIWEMDRSSLHSYKGNYAYYLENKAARIENQLSQKDKAQNQFRTELEWMRKQPRARTTKSKSRIDAFYELEEKAKERLGESNLQLQVKMNRLGGKVLEMKKVYKAFGSQTILKGFDYTFSKGERIGIVGKNGVGKSTFLNLLQGLETADSGKINPGETVVFGYYNQQGLFYKEDVRVIEFVKQFAESFPLAGGGSLSATKFLELFLFPPEKQYTYLSALSGGEKRRLQLLVMLFSNTNFLILDEPTNDLDLPTLGVLEKFLATYPGCVLLVSHDRYFMDKIVDHLFVFEGDGVVKDFPGNYSQYRLARLKEESMATAGEVGETIENSAIEKPVIDARAKSKQSFKIQREIQMLEKELPLLAEKKSALEKQMNESTDYVQLQQLASDLETLNAKLETLEFRWLELNEMK